MREDDQTRTLRVVADALAGVLLVASILTGSTLVMAALVVVLVLTRGR